MTDTTQSKIMIGEAQHKKAVLLASTTSPTMNDAMIRVANAKDEYSGAPIALMHAMIATMPEQVDELPRPGSKWNETDNPDVFIYRDPAKPDAKDKEVSFYTVWPDNTPEGNRVGVELDYLARLSDDKYVTSDIPEDYKARYSNPEMRKKRKKYLNGRRGTVRAQYKQVGRLIFQMEAINELAGVHAETIPGHEPGTYETVILIRSTVKGRETLDYDHFSVGQFLKLNAAKAAENGGTLEALKATVARDTKKKEPEKGIPALAEVRTPETADKVAVAYLAYLDSAWSDKKGDDYRNFLKFLTGTREGATAIHTMGGIRKILNDLWKMDKIASTYDAQEEANNLAA